MKRNMALIDVLLKIRMKKVCILILTVACVCIMGTFVFADNFKISTAFRATDALITVALLAGYIACMIICMDLGLLKNKKLMLLKRLGLSEKERYISELVANTMTFAVIYLLATVIVSVSFYILVRIQFGTENMVHLMVIHNISYLFGELLPIYEPVLIIRNIILILCFGLLSANVAIQRQNGSKAIVPSFGMGFLISGFITRTGILVSGDWTIPYKIYIGFILTFIVLITLISVIQSVSICKKGGYREGELV